MCNRSNPAPHRIFIDLKVLSNSTDNGTELHKVIIKGIPANTLTSTPLPALLMKLIQIMQIPIRETDLGDIVKVANTLHVSFNSEKHMGMFLANKYKLKKNPQTSAIIIHEEVDPDIKELFRYSHKLKDVGYNIFFIKNRKVFVKKEKTSMEINITSKEHVDRMCGEQNVRTLSGQETRRNTESHSSRITSSGQADRQRSEQPNNRISISEQHNRQIAEPPGNRISISSSPTHFGQQFVHDDADWRAIIQILEEENTAISGVINDDYVWSNNRQQNVGHHTETAEETPTTCWSGLKDVFKKIVNKIFCCC